LTEWRTARRSSVGARTHDAGFSVRTAREQRDLAPLQRTEGWEHRIGSEPPLEHCSPRSRSGGPDLGTRAQMHLHGSFPTCEDRSPPWRKFLVARSAYPFGCATGPPRSRYTAPMRCPDVDEIRDRQTRGAAAAFFLLSSWVTAPARARTITPRGAQLLRPITGVASGEGLLPHPPSLRRLRPSLTVNPSPAAA
jgi:hypothetical protein